MEKAEQTWEQEGLEEKEDEETTLIVRKSRNGNESKNTEIAAVDVEVGTNEVSESNGHTIESEVAENGDENEEPTLGEEHKIEELDGVLENEVEPINGDLQIEELNGVLGNEVEPINGDLQIEELNGVLGNEVEPINGDLQIEELNVVLGNEVEPINGDLQIEELNVVLGHEVEANGDHKIEELSRVLENEIEPINGDNKIEELNGVLENGSEARNGEQKSENLVFYDKVGGIWKCRICTWTYGNGSVCVDHVQDHKGLLHKLMNVKTLNFESQGVESASAYFGEKQIVKDIFTGSKLQPSQVSSHEHSTSYTSSKEIESAEIDLINEDDLEIAESDVERVIQKQTTHDLYCPNCNSCITKRIILRKRKRRVRVSEEEVKRNKINADSKLVTGTGSVQLPGVQVGDNDTPLPTTEEDERDRGPDLFRCLSCFSFFIPTGNGIKLFRNFGDKSGKENVRDEQAPAVKKNWFSSMFASNKQEITVEQGSSSRTDVPQGDVGVTQSSNLSNRSDQQSSSQKVHSPAPAVNNNNPDAAAKVLPSLAQEPSLNGQLVNDDGDNLDTTATATLDATMDQLNAYMSDQLKDSKSITEVDVDRDRNLSVTTLPKITQVTNGEYKEDAISFSQQDGLKLLFSSNKGSQTLENSDEELLTKPVSVHKASDVDGKLNISVSIPHEEQDIRATLITQSVLENKNANFGSSDGGQVDLAEAPQHIITKTEFQVHSSEPLKLGTISALHGTSVAQGKDTVITIDTQPAVSTQAVQTITDPAEATTTALQSANQINNANRARTEARNELQIEVIKSIVYGGLAESITSLSVVSSAAGGGAATLNILALGMANLIGGLFVICHNLWDLKSEGIVEQITTQVSDEATEQRDRYKELLGRRHNFILHAIVAIISYIVFGLVPPVVYGFSFHKTDDRQFKLLVVAAASLFCIVMLAIGRAHVRRPPKSYLQSVATFVVLGFMVSGVSYAAGELVERLIEKLGLFESGTGTVPNAVVPQMMMMAAPAGSGMASY